MFLVTQSKQHLRNDNSVTFHLCQSPLPPSQRKRLIQLYRSIQRLLDRDVINDWYILFNWFDIYVRYKCKLWNFDMFREMTRWSNDDASKICDKWHKFGDKIIPRISIIKSNDIFYELVPLTQWRTLMYILPWIA